MSDQPQGPNCKRPPHIRSVKLGGVLKIDKRITGTKQFRQMERYLRKMIKLEKELPRIPTLYDFIMDQQRNGRTRSQS